MIKRSEESQANDSGERGHTKGLHTELASAAGGLLLWWDVGGARPDGWQRASAEYNTGGRVLGVRDGARAEGGHLRNGSRLGRGAGGGERRGRAIARGSQSLDDAKNGAGSRVGGRCGRQAVVVAWWCWCGGLAVAVGSDSSAGALEDGSRGDKRRGGEVEEAHSECGETCRLGSPMGSQVGCAMTEWWNAEATRLVC